MSSFLESILTEYDNNLSELEHFKDKVTILIKDLVKVYEINVHSIEGRVKERESLKKKILKKDKYKSLSDVTDVLGIRIITYFEDDVDKLANVLENEFNLDKKNCIDKRIKENPEVFGYSSLHYVMSINEQRTNLKEFEIFKDKKFEVQVRSILQHAWAEIEHDLGYKNDNVPKNVLRDFSRISSLLEMADMEFIRVRENLDSQKSLFKQNLEAENISLEPINSLTYSEFIKSDKFGMYNKILGKNLWEKNRIKFKAEDTTMNFDMDLFEFFDVKYINDILEILEEKQKIIFEIMIEWFRIVDPIIFSEKKLYAVRDILIFYFFLYLLLMQEENNNKVKNFFELRGVSDVEKCCKDFYELKEKVKNIL